MIRIENKKENPMCANQPGGNNARNAGHTLTAHNRWPLPYLTKTGRERERERERKKNERNETKERAKENRNARTNTFVDKKKIKNRAVTVQEDEDPL